MADRIRWVLAAYLTNKWFLVALGIVALWAIVSMLVIYGRVPTRQSTVPAAPRGKLVVADMASLESVRHRQLASQVDEIDLGRLWRQMERNRQDAAGKRADQRYSIGEPPLSFYDLLDEFPNLKFVHASIYTSDEAIERIGSLRQVTYLHLTMYAPCDLAPLARLQELERLDLSLTLPPGGLKLLAALPRLKTLVLLTVEALDDAILADVAALQNLETLAVTSPSVATKLSDAGIAQLARAPRLTTIYLPDGPSPSQLDLFTRVKAALPGVAVLPSVVPARLPIMAFYFPLIFTAVVGSQLARQFRNSASRLAPEFVAAHLLVAAAWIAVIVVAISIAFVLTGWSLTTGLIVGGIGALATFSTGILITAQTFCGPNLPGAKPNIPASKWDAAAMIGLPAAGIACFVPDIAARLDGYLAVIAIVASVASLGFLQRTLRLLRDIPSLEASSGSDQRGDNPSFRLAVSAASMLRRESLIESWARNPPGWSPYERILRWRAGNPPRPALFVPLMVLSAVVVGYVFHLAMNRLAGFDFALKLYCIGIPLLLVVGQATTDWRKRVMCLEVESLRPVARSVLQREWAVALLWDLAIVSIFCGAMTTILLNAPDDWNSLSAWRAALQPWLQKLVMLGVFSGTYWLATAAVCSMAIVIQRKWLILACGVALLVVASGIWSVYIAFFTGAPQVPVEPIELLPPMLMLSGLSAIVIAWMWRLWMRIDFDRR